MVAASGAALLVLLVLTALSGGELVERLVELDRAERKGLQAHCAYRIAFEFRP